MPITLDGTNGITTPTYGGADTSEYLVPVTQFKNRIINGAMVIDQRNAGASFTPTATVSLTYGSCDRWAGFCFTSSKFSMQQSTVVPAGFRNSLLVTSASAYSVPAGESYNIVQAIEGFNCADLGWGTANAQTVTLSFWVRSSLTGTFGGSIQNSASNRSYPFTYTISSANTYEYKTVTIAGDTSGTWLTNNGVGMYVWFGLGTGSTYSGTAGSWSGSNFFSATGATSVVGTNGATFYITGVQLEVGSTATSFDYRPYGTELALCQRYYAKFGATSSGPTTVMVGVITGSINCSYATITFPVAMRSAPTMSQSGYRVYDGTDATPISSISGTNNTTTQGTANLVCSGGAFTTGRCGTVLSNSSTANYIDFSAEL